MRIASIALVCLALGCGSAFAADPETPSPEIDQARFGWTGFYAGVSAGYGWLKDVDYAPPPGLPNPLHDKGQDWVAGAHAGYLYQMDQLGGLVIGGEAEALSLDIAYEGFTFITIQNAYVLKARAGFAIDRTLISGHVGGTYTTTNYLKLQDWGWTAGLNVDYALTDNIIVGGQYSHYGFSEFDGTRIDADIDLLTARVSWKF